MSEKHNATTATRSAVLNAGEATEGGPNSTTPAVVHVRLMGLDEEPLRLVIDQLKSWMAPRLRFTRVRLGCQGDWLAYGYVTTDHSALCVSSTLQVHPTPRGIVVQQGDTAIAIEGGDVEALADAVQQHKRQKRSRGRTRTR